MMKNYKQVYCDYFGHQEDDTILCEITGSIAVDISHNKARGMGGSKHKDVIENLMALTRGAHTFLEQNPRYYWWFQLVHMHFMVTRTPYAESLLSLDDIVFNEIKNKL